MLVTRKAERLANGLLEMPKSENDVEAAALLRYLSKVYELAHEMAHAKTHEQSKDAYIKMIKLMKGETND
jgi:hypothetical protein